MKRTFNDVTESSGEMDSYAIVPVPERKKKFFNAPERSSK